jgi:phytol kinase
VSNPDVWGLLISFIYVVAVIGLGEWLRRKQGYSAEFLRKVIHIGVGLWSIGAVLLFENRYMAIIPPLSFVVINAISYRFQLVESMDAIEDRSPGTIYFPIAFVLVILFFWDAKPLVVASLMPLTLGDASAAIVGRAGGRTKFSVFGRQRSVQGSASMFLFSSLGVALALWLMPAMLDDPILARLPLVAGSLLVAAIVTIVEAITPWNLDNLSVPLVSMLALSAIIV